jgi:hypothetical protein
MMVVFERDKREMMEMEMARKIKAIGHSQAKIIIIWSDGAARSFS